MAKLEVHTFDITTVKKSYLDIHIVHQTCQMSQCHWWYLSLDRFLQASRFVKFFLLVVHVISLEVNR